MIIIKPLREGYRPSTFDEDTLLLSALANSLYWAKFHGAERVEFSPSAGFTCFRPSGEVVDIADVGQPSVRAREKLLSALKTNGLLLEQSAVEFCLGLDGESFGVVSSTLDELAVFRFERQYGIFET